MNPASSVLLAVAAELAALARDSLPEIHDGTQIRREWYADGVFYRESVSDGQAFVDQFDFRQRKSRRVAVTK